MRIDVMREGFEKAFLAQRPEHGTLPLERDGDGDYINWYVQQAWESWQMCVNYYFPVGHTRPEEKQRKKKYGKLFMLYVQGSGVPKIFHTQERRAEREGERLNLITGNHVYLMRSVKCIGSQPPVAPQVDQEDCADDENFSLPI